MASERAKKSEPPGITKRTTATDQVRWDASFRDPSGKERSKTFRTKKQAEKWRRDQLNALDRGLWLDPSFGRITLADWSEQWLSTVVNLRPSTRRIYADNLRLHVLPTLGHLELGKLDDTVLADWLNALTVKDLHPSKTKGKKSGPSTDPRVLSAGSVHQVYRTLNRVLNMAVKRKKMARNPLASVDPPQLVHEEMRFLTPGQVADLAETIEPRYRAFVLVAAYCGLRLGELAALRWHRVDTMRRTLKVAEQLDRDHQTKQWVLRAPKSAAGIRNVSMPRLVAQALDEHRAAGYGDPSTDGFVFTRTDGGALDVNYFRRTYWTPATARAGVSGLRIHDLRHTCASLAIAAGADVKVLQKMLGHASAAMTLDRYGHLMPGQSEAVADRLDALAEQAARPPLAKVVGLNLPRDARGMGPGADH